jgi:hypothetical protein
MKLRSKILASAQNTNDMSSTITVFFDGAVLGATTIAGAGFGGCCTKLRDYHCSIYGSFSLEFKCNTISLWLPAEIKPTYLAVDLSVAPC